MWQFSSVSSIYSQEDHIGKREIVCDKNFSLTYLFDNAMGAYDGIETKLMKGN